MTRPLLLDLFCCEGGAARGYNHAGFDVVGVDNDARFRKRYPYEFVHADAIEVLHDAAFLSRFAAVHASPPCQHASAGTRGVDRSSYERLIEPTRDALVANFDGPWVIENVAGSALIDPMILCGTMFGLTAYDDDGTPLEMWRHRHWESNVPLAAPGPCRHHEHSFQVAGVYGGARQDKDEARYERHGGYVPSRGVQELLMDLYDTTQHGLHQAVPPAYTEWVGSLLMEAL